MDGEFESIYFTVCKEEIPNNDVKPDIQLTCISNYSDKIRNGNCENLSDTLGNTNLEKNLQPDTSSDYFDIFHSNNMTEVNKDIMVNDKLYALDKLIKPEPTSNRPDNLINDMSNCDESIQLVDTSTSLSMKSEKQSKNEHLSDQLSTDPINQKSLPQNFSINEKQCSITVPNLFLKDESFFSNSSIQQYPEIHLGKEEIKIEQQESNEHNSFIYFTSEKTNNKNSIIEVKQEPLVDINNDSFDLKENTETNKWLNLEMVPSVGLHTENKNSTTFQQSENISLNFQKSILHDICPTSDVTENLSNNNLDMTKLHNSFNNDDNDISMNDESLQTQDLLEVIEDKQQQTIPNGDLSDKGGNKIAHNDQASTQDSKDNNENHMAEDEREVNFDKNDQPDCEDNQEIIKTDDKIDFKDGENDDRIRRHYKCKFCKKRFITESFKKKHETKHIIDKLSTSSGQSLNQSNKHKPKKRQKPAKEKSSSIYFQCYICQYKTCNYDDLTSHMTSHDTEKTLPCRICKRKFFKQTSLEKHLKSHSNAFQCKLCLHKSTNEFEFNKHAKYHPIETVKQAEGKKPEYNNETQTKTINNPYVLERISSIIDRNSYRCEKCFKTFATIFCKSNHECKLISKNNLTRKSLIHELPTHNEPNSAKDILVTQTNLNSSQVILVPSQASNNQNSTQNNVVQTQQNGVYFIQQEVNRIEYKCSKCQFTTFEIDKFQLHNELHIKETEWRPMNATTIAPTLVPANIIRSESSQNLVLLPTYNCNTVMCNYSTYNKIELKQHEKTHKQSQCIHNCKLCKYSTKYLSEFEEHYTNAHRPRRSFFRKILPKKN